MNSFLTFFCYFLRPKDRKSLAAALLALFLLPMPADTLAGEQPTVTLLVYMTGSDLETRGQAASRDMEEMAEFLPISGGIRVLVQAGGAESWGMDIDPACSTRLELIDGLWQKVEESDTRNMAQADTLKDFLLWGYAYAPSDHYALILWNHGAGPLLGICLDEQFQDPDSGLNTLTLRELANALQASPFQREKLIFIGFDACLMCTLEVASTVSPYADCMIASQETEPASGWNYAFLKDLSGETDGRVWGHRIVDAYRDSLKGSLNPATLACLDLGKTSAVLRELESCFGSLAEKVSPETYSDFTRCRADAKIFGIQTTSAFDLVDLMDLILCYEKEGLAEGSALRDAIEEMVLCSCAENAVHTNGLSIYYPFDNKSAYVASWSAEYQKSSFSPAYRSFISRISEFYLHDSLFRMTSEYLTDLREEAGSVRVRLPLTAEDTALLLRARMLVLEKLGKEAYRFVFYNDQTIRTTDRDISCRYNGEGLFIVNGEGEILQGPLSYFPADNGVAIYGFLYYGLTSYAARLIYQNNEEGQLVLSQVLTAQGEKPDWVFLPSSLDPAKSTEMLIVSFGPLGLENDTLTSLDYTVFYPEFTYRLDLNDPDQHLALLPGWSRYDRYAYLRLTDIQGETVCSTPARIPSYAHITVAGPRELECHAGLALSLSSGTLVTGNDAGLMFTLTAQNQKDSSLTLRISGISLNGNISLSPWQFQAFRYLLTPEEEDEITVFIPLGTLLAEDLPSQLTSTEITFSVEHADGSLQKNTVSIPMEMDASMIH